MKQTTSIKLDSNVKSEAQKIFAELGLTLGEAVNLFLNQVRLNKGLPFEVKIPNKETLKAIQDVEKGINLETVTFEQLQDEMKKCIEK
jgi:DNA-damage-inducible protein J